MQLPSSLLSGVPFSAKLAEFVYSSTGGGCEDEDTPRVFPARVNVEKQPCASVTDLLVASWHAGPGRHRAQVLKLRPLLWRVRFLFWCSFDVRCCFACCGVRLFLLPFPRFAFLLGLLRFPRFLLALLLLILIFRVFLLFLLRVFLLRILVPFVFLGALLVLLILILLICGTEPRSAVRRW